MNIRKILLKKEYVINYINKHANQYKKLYEHEVFNVCDRINERVDNVNKYINTSIDKKSEYSVFLNLYGFIRDYYKYLDELEEMINRKSVKEVRYTYTSSSKKSNVLSLILGTFSALYDYSTTKEKPINNSGYTDKELDSYGLNEEEKMEAYEGDFEPWNFEDDETYNRADKE